MKRTIKETTTAGENNVRLFGKLDLEIIKTFTWIFESWYVIRGEQGRLCHMYSRFKIL
jgi:hypothetical protein